MLCLWYKNNRKQSRHLNLQILILCNACCSLVNERKLIKLQLEQCCPEDKSLSQGSMENLGVKELLQLLRRHNADRNRGELNYRFIEWILNNEHIYCEKISNIYKVGNQKVKFTYYGMVFTILKWEGCYVKGKGKQEALNDISYQKYVGEELLNLENRLKSKNVRKTLAGVQYSYNYYLIKDDSDDPFRDDRIYKELKPIFTEIIAAIREKQFI